MWKPRKIVDLIKGGGKFSSPYSVEAFGDQNPPKMGVCDMYWITIFFLIYRMHLEWKRWMNHLTGLFFTDEIQFGILGLETLLKHFWGIKWHFLGVKPWFFSVEYHFHILHANTFLMIVELLQSESIWKRYVIKTWTFYVDLHNLRGWHVIPHYS